MYTRNERERPFGRVSIPDNYGGSAFNSSEDKSKVNGSSLSDEIQSESQAKKKGIFRFLSDNDDLILIALIFLFFQEGADDGIIPMLIMLLFFKK